MNEKPLRFSKISTSHLSGQAAEIDPQVLEEAMSMIAKRIEQRTDTMFLLALYKVPEPPKPELKVEFDNQPPAPPYLFKWRW